MTMVLEHALMNVRPGEEERFEAALDEALEVIGAADGCGTVTVLRGIESPSTYLLLVEWASLDAHTEGFRGSDAFARWRALVSPWWSELPVVEHFAPAKERRG
jgi:quinol monooxygenase YgiN